MFAIELWQPVNSGRASKSFLKDKWNLEHTEYLEDNDLIDRQEYH